MNCMYCQGMGELDFPHGNEVCSVCDGSGRDPDDYIDAQFFPFGGDSRQLCRWAEYRSDDNRACMVFTRLVSRIANKS